MVGLHVNGPQINWANVVFIFRMFQLMVLVRLFFTLSDEVKGQAKNGLKGQLSAVLSHIHTHTHPGGPPRHAMDTQKDIWDRLKSED